MQVTVSDKPRQRRRRRSEILPDLAPPPETGWWRRTTGPEGTRIEAGSAPTEDRPAKPSFLARIGVGAVSAVLFLAVVPVGAGLLTLNAFGGAQLRITAQVAALAGLWVPLAPLIL